MPSYGAFCAEFCVERPETNRDALRTQDRTKKAFFQNLKNAGRHRLTSEDFPNPPPSPLNKSNCSSPTFPCLPPGIALGHLQSIPSSSTPSSAVQKYLDRREILRFRKVMIETSLLHFLI